MFGAISGNSREGRVMLYVVVSPGLKKELPVFNDVIYVTQADEAPNPHSTVVLGRQEDCLQFTGVRSEQRNEVGRLSKALNRAGYTVVTR